MKRFLKVLKRIFRPRYVLIAIVTLFLGFFILDWLAPLPEPKPFSTQIYDREDNLLAAYLSEDDKWRFRSPTTEVSEEMKTAILAKEDQWFYWHPGVNVISIVRALWSNLWSGKRISGASTITMQVARMLEPKPRTFGNKIFEVFRALQLEWHYTKDEILEMYLSYLPYGGNIEGVKAASYIYFGRPPEKLSLAQATLLTVIPNRPNSLRLDTRRDQARRERDRWLRYFDNEEVFSKDQIRIALAEPIAASRRNLLPQAPQFSRRVAQLHARNPNCSSEVMATTLDPEIQATASQLLSNYVRRARSKGISNGAVLIVDNATSEVLAYCGSADFFDEDAAGQVDGVQAIRSPGSALKPVVYALAFDKGILTPDKRMLDIPRTWNGYSPRNFDETFRGPVSVAYALRNSLNVTAVQALSEVGFDHFMDAMEVAGMQSLKEQRKELGLSTILGGCGVTLEEMVRLFSSFAREGKLRPLVFTHSKEDRENSGDGGSVADRGNAVDTGNAGDRGNASDTGNAADEGNATDRSNPGNEFQGIPLFSEGSAWLIWQILSSIERPDLPTSMVGATNRAKIAWKTGTSYGRRDAWSIGFTPRYTVGVWIGNFDGKGVPDLTGAGMAVPLLFDIFGAIEAGKKPLEFPQPTSVDLRTVCSETGELPSEKCSKTHEGYYLVNHSFRTVCDQEEELYIKEDSSIQYCTGCLPPSAYTKASYPIYPPELTLWYEDNEVPYLRPPPHNPDCEATFDGPGPTITSPLVDYEYLLEGGVGQEILLQTSVDTRTNRNYWYVNGEFYRSAAPGEKVFYPARQGKLKVTCMDDKGRSTVVVVDVKEY